MGPGWWLLAGVMALLLRMLPGLRFRWAWVRGCYGSARGDAGSPTKCKTSVSRDEWRKKLTPEQFHVTREKGTEPPFSGIYLDNKETGMYHCVCCDSPLFRCLWRPEISDTPGAGVVDSFELPNLVAGN